LAANVIVWLFVVEIFIVEIFIVEIFVVEIFVVLAIKFGKVLGFLFVAGWIGRRWRGYGDGGVVSD
jgi:hypothetical protein